MYDMIKDDNDLQDWQKKNIQQARDLLDKALMYSEYDQMFPNKEEKVEEEKDKTISFQIRTKDIRLQSHKKAVINVLQDAY